MQLSLAQGIGIFVTFIYGLGSDVDLVFAVPVGFLAGAMAWAVEQGLAQALERIQYR